MFKKLKKLKNEKDGKINFQVITGVATLGLLVILVGAFLLGSGFGSQSVLNPGTAKLTGSSGPTGNPGLKIKCLAQENERVKNECNITLYDPDTFAEVAAQQTTSSGEATFANLPGDTEVVAVVLGAGSATAIYPTSALIPTPTAGTDSYSIGYFSQNNNTITTTVYDPPAHITQNTTDFAMNQDESRVWKAVISMPGSTTNDYNVFGSGQVPEWITDSDELDKAKLSGVIHHDSNLFAGFEVRSKDSQGNEVVSFAEADSFRGATEPDSNRSSQWYFDLPIGQLLPNQTYDVFITAIADPSNPPCNASTGNCNDTNAGLDIRIYDSVYNENVRIGEFEYSPTNQSSGATLGNTSDIPLYVNIG